MIEIVYKEETEAEDTNIKLPRNVKQIGTGGGTRKVYIEDYAAGFIKIHPKSDEDYRYGVLIGDIKRSKAGTYVFVRGVVEADEHGQIRFDDEIWTGIYSDIKHYYSENEIVGWFLNVPVMDREWRVKFQKLHLDNFAGSDRICFFCDRSENEEAIYSYDSGMMQKRHGYFVYYEKNPEMQAYMIDKNPNDGETPKNNVKVNSGSIYRDKGFDTAAGDKGKSKRMPSFLYSASSFLAVAVLVATITLMNNYGQMQKLKGSLDKIADNMKSAGGSSTVSKSVDDVQQDTAHIEVIQGEVDTTPENADENQTPSGQTDTSVQPEQVTDTATPESTNAGENVTQAETTQAEKSTDTAAKSTEYNFYIVQKGETLSKICEKIYGTQDRKPEVMEANGITDENKIYIGQKIILP